MNCLFLNHIFQNILIWQLNGIRSLGDAVISGLAARNTSTESHHSNEMIQEIVRAWLSTQNGIQEESNPER